ncbi:MAG: ROK family protein [Gemmatimonadales bacterium]
MNRRLGANKAILVIDVGGTHVKLLATGHRKRREFRSGAGMTAGQMVEAVTAMTADWKYDTVTIGYPGPIRCGRPVAEPHNLGPGWIAFDFTKAFGRPVRMINDAAMQALGDYRGGPMLFLGLGTGLGSALILDGVLVPLELAHLPYKKGRTYEEFLGLRGLKRLGRSQWEKCVWDVVALFKAALQVDEVVLGGGNALRLKALPPGSRRGENSRAFVGGFRLWDALRHPPRSR